MKRRSTGTGASPCAWRWRPAASPRRWPPRLHVFAGVSSVLLVTPRRGDGAADREPVAGRLATAQPAAAAGADRRLSRADGSAWPPLRFGRASVRLVAGASLGAGIVVAPQLLSGAGVCAGRIRARDDASVKIRIGYGFGDAHASSTTSASPRSVDALERLRFDSLWLSERLGGEAPDPIVAMAYAAGRTTKLKFGMSVLVLPGRNPVVLAKELATLDRLSAGRLLPAFGLGVADPHEQQAFGVAPPASAPPGSTRRCRSSAACGSRTSSTTTARASTTRGCGCCPSPCSSLPTSGSAASLPPSCGRVGRLGDGWLPSFIVPDEVASGRKVIEEVAAEHGRAIDPEHFGVLIAYAMSEPEARVPGAAGQAPARPRPDRARPGRAATTLARRIDAFVDAGTSKFVVLPFDEPPGGETGRPPGRGGRRPAPAADMTEALFEPDGDRLRPDGLRRGPVGPACTPRRPDRGAAGAGGRGRPDGRDRLRGRPAHDRAAAPGAGRAARDRGRGRSGPAARCSSSRRRCATPNRARSWPAPAPCASARRRSRCRTTRCSPSSPPPPGPERSRREVSRFADDYTAFHNHGVEHRFVAGSWLDAGPVDGVDPAAGARRRRRGAEPAPARRRRGRLRQRREPRAAVGDLHVHQPRSHHPPAAAQRSGRGCASTRVRCSARTASASPRAPCSTHAGGSVARSRASSWKRA